MSPGTISYSDAPHEPSRAQPLEAPMLALGNGLVAATLYLPWRTARVRWVRPVGDVLGPALASGRPIVYYSWHAYEPFLLLAFRDVPPDLVPLAIGHDGFKSRLLHRTATTYGFPVWVYRRRSTESPTRQIVRMLQKDSPVVALVADAGAAPRTVRPGFAEVVRSTEALLVPIAIRAPLRVPLGRPWRYGLPLPFGTVEVHVGDPVDGRTATPESCREALTALE